MHAHLKEGNKLIPRKNARYSTVTIQTIIPYSTTITACGSNNSTMDGNNTSTTNSSIALPKEGQSCSVEGSFKCSGPASFAQCVYGKYTIRRCAPATICKNVENATPPSIYCGFP